MPDRLTIANNAILAKFAKNAVSGSTAACRPQFEKLRYDSRSWCMWPIVVSILPGWLLFEVSKRIFSEQIERNVCIVSGGCTMKDYEKIWVECRYICRNVDALLILVLGLLCDDWYVIIELCADSYILKNLENSTSNFRKIVNNIFRV